jgi:4-hydroxybenzoate polyprenyltransferase
MMATERLLFGSVPSWFGGLHILVFGSTLMVYNAPRIVRRFAVQPYRGWYFFFFFAGAAMVLATVRVLPGRFVLVCALLALFTFAYSLPLLPFKEKKRLRDFGWVKILVLAGVWTIVTSVLPMMYGGVEPGRYPFEVVIRFVFIFTLCMVFDIRDMPADQRNNIATVPHRVGLRNSYRLIYVALGLFAVLACGQCLRVHDGWRLVGTLLTVCATGAMVEYLKRWPTERAYMLLADGVMLVYAVLVML